LDQIAAEVNRGHVFDMPNGNGFCMYITRRCLDTVGLLSTDFNRGYFEDVEYCLRASAAGFRSVCATDVFVGHAGSRSFKAQKRSLVVRNLGVLEGRWPAYRAASAAFVAADPLRSARARIERIAMETQKVSVVVATETTEKALVEARARQIKSRGTEVV